MARPNPIIVDALPTGRLRFTIKDTAGNDHVIDGGVDVQPDGVNDWTAVQGVVTPFIIQSYHFCDTYDVATANGVVSTEENTILYTPETVGAGGFTVNGFFYAVDVLAE